MSSISILLNGPSPVTDRFYKCVNNTCTETLDSTAPYKNDKTCGGSCSSNSTPALYVNDLQGSVNVALNTPVTLRIQGIGAGKAVRIDNISATPDAIIAQGTTDSNGVFQTTVNFSEYVSMQLRGYYNCVSFVCANETNTINLTAGEKQKDWVATAAYLGIAAIGAYLLGTFIKGRIKE